MLNGIGKYSEFYINLTGAFTLRGILIKVDNQINELNFTESFNLIAIDKVDFEIALYCNNNIKYC